MIVQLDGPLTVTVTRPASTGAGKFNGIWSSTETGSGAESVGGGVVEGELEGELLGVVLGDGVLLDGTLLLGWARGWVLGLGVELWAVGAAATCGTIVSTRVVLGLGTMLVAEVGGAIEAVGVDALGCGAGTDLVGLAGVLADGTGAAELVSEVMLATGPGSERA